MTNEVTNPFGASTSMADRQDMAKRAQESSNKAAQAGAPDGSDYMNFSGKLGKFTIGKDKREVQNDEFWLLNVGSFEDGYICWKGGKPASTRMANIYTGDPIPAPASDELGPFNEAKGDGWYQVKGWVAKSLDYNEQGYFKNNSVSGVAEMAGMLEEVSGRLATGKACWPVFVYDKEGFEAQGFKNFKPLFTIQGWLDDEALAGLVDDFDIEDLMDQSEARDKGAATTKLPPAKGKVEPTPAEKRALRKVADAQATEAEEAAAASQPDADEEDAGEAKESPKRERRTRTKR